MVAEQRSLGVGLQATDDVVPGWPIPGAAPAEAAIDEAPLHLSLRHLRRRARGESIFQRLFQFKRNARTSSRLPRPACVACCCAARRLGWLFFAVGYVLSQPLTKPDRRPREQAGKPGRARGWGQHPAKKFKQPPSRRKRRSRHSQWHGKPEKLRCRRYAILDRSALRFHSICRNRLPSQRRPAGTRAAAPQAAQSKPSPTQRQHSGQSGRALSRSDRGRRGGRKSQPWLMDALGR